MVEVQRGRSRWDRGLTIRMLNKIEVGMDSRRVLSVDGMDVRHRHKGKRRKKVYTPSVGIRLVLQAACGRNHAVLVPT